MLWSIFCSRTLLLVTAASLAAVSLGAVGPAAASGAPPTAVSDAFTVAEGGTATTLTGGATSLLANDTDPENDNLSAAIATAPTYGSLVINADGTFTYVHEGRESTSDSFTYAVNDGTGTSFPVVVRVTVTPVNDAPVAVGDFYSTPEDFVLTVAAGRKVTLNDTDAESNPLTVALVSGPTHGTLTLNPDGTFVYTPNSGYAGTDSFTYRANDGAANSNVATVTLTVTEVDDPPVAVADGATVAEGGTVTSLTGGATSVLANDTDPENGVLTAAVVTGPTNGTLTLNAGGTFSYTHDGGETTTDSFTYRADDGTSSSTIVTVSITVNPVNDAPVAVADGASVLRGGTVTSLTGGATSVLANDTDAETDTLSAVLVAGPTNGTLTLNADGTFSYAHNGSSATTDSFTYRAHDGTVGSAVVTVSLSITSVNGAPVSVADGATAAEGGTVTTLAGGATSVLANDSDPDSDPMTAALVAGPAHGALTLDDDGTFSYTHDGGESTTDSFTYRADDGTATSAVATVTLTVTPVNDAPVAAADSAAVAEGGTSSALAGAAASVLANDTDEDDDPLTAVLVAGPAHGSLTLSANGTFRYTHDGGETTTDSFTYRAHDGSASSSVVTVTITVNPVNDAPTAADDSYSTDEDTVLRVTAATRVTLDDTDAEGSSLTVSLVAGPTHGSLSLNADGSFRYAPDAGYSGTDSFTYRAHDGSASSNVGTVTITVNSVNDAPRISAPADRAVLESGRTGLLVFTVTDDLTSASDLEVIAIADDSGLVPRSGIRLVGTGGRRALQITPATGRWGQAVITLRAADETGARSTASFTLTVLRLPACTLQGTPGDDVLVGTRGRDVICGGGGDDVIRGLAGDDVLRGGRGRDRIFGGGGRDVLIGRSGDDLLVGRSGHDQLLGGVGDDVLRGGPGRDVLQGGPGTNVRHE